MNIIKTNDIIGKLTLLQKNNDVWICQCICGKIVSRKHKYLRDNKNIDRNFSCGCYNKLYQIGNKSHRWNGYGDISGSYFKRLKHDAYKRNIDVQITIKDLWELFISQKGKCALSGEPLSFNKNHSKHYKSQTASVDRIDSSKGYTKDNIQWIHKEINTTKWHFNQEYFLNICALVAKKYI